MRRRSTLRIWVFFLLLGTDVFGNIQRMDNVLDSMSEKSANCVEKLENLKLQAENARQEIAQPFPREAELKAKSARLDELNILLRHHAEDVLFGILAHEYTVSFRPGISVV